MTVVSAKVKLCRLERAVGREALCTFERCPFWEEGGAVVEGGCALERLGIDLDSSPGFAQWLLEMRHKLAEARTPEERAEALRLFQEVLPPGLRE